MGDDVKDGDGLMSGEMVMWSVRPYELNVKA